MTVLGWLGGIGAGARIAVRARSPGINDPTTATNCIDYLGVILARLAGRRFPSPYRKADDGRVLVVTSRPGFADMVRLAFDQIQLYGERDPRVLTRLVETLVHLSEQSEDLERLAPLVRMASAVARRAESLEPEWRDRLLPLTHRVALRDRGHGDAREAARTAGVVH